MVNKMSLGHISNFKVDRETDLGYVLVDNEGKEFFLHHNECNYQKLSNGDKVNAFIYLDKKGRETATLNPPSITLDKIGSGIVTSVKPEMGAFINIGITKDILLSKDDLPIGLRTWPKEGDKVFCVMRLRSGKLILKLATKSDLSTITNDTTYNEGEYVDSYVYRITQDGINLVTDDFKVIFVHKDNLRGTFRIGQKESVRIVHKNPTDYNGSLVIEKKEQIKNDKEIILDYLNHHNGVMMITESSSPELINHHFHMSKSSFKNAIGGLLKENKVEKLEDKIILKD